MRLSTGRQIYLPLVLLFWLFGSVGSFVLGEELHRMPQALSGVTSTISQGIGSLVAAMGTEVGAVQPERGPVTLTAQSNPPRVTTTSAPSAPHTAAPAAPTAHHGGGNDKHGGDGNTDKGHKGGSGKDGGHGSGDHNSGGSDD